jgi:hypothetical protein
MYIGSLLFFGLFGSPLWLLIFRSAVPDVCRSIVAGIRQFAVDGSIPALDRAFLFQWSGLSLVSFGGFLFIHYCARLGQRGGFLPGCSLWKWTIIHLLCFVCWLGLGLLNGGVPELIVFAIVLLFWGPFIAMAIRAWIVCANPVQPERSNEPHSPLSAGQ